MKQRILSIVILAPIFIFFIWLGDLWFLIACLFIFGICAWEFGKIYTHDSHFTTPTILLPIFVAFMLLSRYFIGFDASHRTMTICIMASMLWGIIACEKQYKNAALGFAAITCGTVYVGWLGGYMISLRMQENGFWYLLLCLFLTWAADIGAFLVGKAFGKHKMLPFVSPKKTWEGYLGGIVFALLAAYLLDTLVQPIDNLLTLPHVLLLSALVSILSPIGDFGESMIKRSFDVKDSSNLIPGHGGYLDRFDSILWSLPLCYYFFEMVNLGII